MRTEAELNAAVTRLERSNRSTKRRLRKLRADLAQVRAILRDGDDGLPGAIRLSHAEGEYRVRLPDEYDEHGLPLALAFGSLAKPGPVIPHGHVLCEGCDGKGGSCAGCNGAGVIKLPTGTVAAKAPPLEATSGPAREPFLTRARAFLSRLVGR